jgi:hypothetical protein
MSGLGHVLKLFYNDLGPLVDAALVLLALSVAWLGYRHSRPDYTRSSKNPLSLRQPPEA